MHIAPILLASAMLAAPDLPATPALPGAAPSMSAAPFCSGDYADELVALSAQARLQDQRQAPFTYCVRSTATYECPSYGADGALRRTRRSVVAHGTAFGLRQEAGETLLVTNDHVSEWPEVTDEDHGVEGVPAGCRRVGSALRIVDDEADAYDRDDVPASRVVADAELDVSVLRARAALPVLPWRFGHSAGLRERNVVDVRGFPLGALRAHNVGKVISTQRHDEDNGWDHDDFVVDALLSPGNSGSPVLAVSCQTGELELVGVYHARYTRANALHTVVGIDQLKELLTTLQRPQRQKADPAVVARDVTRARIAESAKIIGQAFFPFGTLTAAVRARDDGALLFELMSKDFPVQGHPALVIEDLPPTDPSRPGAIGRVWAGNRQGLRDVTDSRGAAADLWPRVADALRKDALLAVEYRATARSGAASREQFQETRKRERALRRAASSHSDLAQAALDAVEQLFPRSADADLGLADVLRAAPPAPETPAWTPPELVPSRPGGSAAGGGAAPALVGFAKSAR